jgi:IS30 family transposase
MEYQHFSIEERETIQAMWWRRESVRSIALALNRSPSSVLRELKRNFPLGHRVYTPRLAHEKALVKRRCRGRTERLKNDAIRSYVIAHLQERWSPEQIAGRIRIDLRECISHEAIYQYIYSQISKGTGEAKTGCLDLRPYLRRRKKGRSPKGMRRREKLFVPARFTIDARPAVVSARSRIGDWEGDTVESRSHKPGVNTLVERKTGFVFVTKLKGKTSADTLAAVSKRFESLPLPLKRTLTLDRGAENRRFKEMEKRAGVKCFLAHPYSAFERGTNENTNGLLRDYFPKKTDFTIIQEEEIAYVERALNSRPRKRLGWRTPQEVMGVALQG